MSEPEIFAIYPIGEFGCGLCVYQVGLNGVTKIVEEQYSPEPYCCRVNYLVYVEDNKLLAKVMESAVSNIVYKTFDPGV